MTLNLSNGTGQVVQAAELTGTFEIRLTCATAGDTVFMETLGRVFWRAQVPARDTPVLEVVPTNGVLRKVRSPGPWASKPAVPTTLATDTSRSWLEFGRSRGHTNSLWLRQGPQRDSVGVLVAAHADPEKVAPSD